MQKQADIDFIDWYTRQCKKKKISVTSRIVLWNKCKKNKKCVHECHAMYCEDTDFTDALRHTVSTVTGHLYSQIVNMHKVKRANLYQFIFSI